MTPEQIGLTATIIGIITALASWWRWGRPKVQQAKREATAMRDAILGRERVVDSITGRELAEPLPGIGVRMAHQEEQMRMLTDAVSKIADSHQRLGHIEVRVDGLEEDVADLKAGRMERIIARAESAQAWSAVEAVAKSTPPDQIDE